MLSKRGCQAALISGSGGRLSGGRSYDAIMRSPSSFPYGSVCSCCQYAPKCPAVYSLKNERFSTKGGTIGGTSVAGRTEKEKPATCFRR